MAGSAPVPLIGLPSTGMLPCDQSNLKNLLRESSGILTSRLTPIGQGSHSGFDNPFFGERLFSFLSFLSYLVGPPPKTTQPAEQRAELLQLYPNEFDFPVQQPESERFGAHCFGPESNRGKAADTTGTKKRFGIESGKYVLQTRETLNKPVSLRRCVFSMPVDALEFVFFPSWPASAARS